MTTDKPLVGVIMGSDSDLDIMKRCTDKLAEFGIPYEMRILSAHRTPEKVKQWASEAVGRGMKVIIAGAGMSAALGGSIAAETTLPVIGVPIDSGPLVGVDAVLSTMQMPPGVPVACMAIGKAGATNAAVFAAEIIATSDEKMAERLRNFKSDQAQKVVEKDEALRSR